MRATMITYVNPAVALALGVILLREPFTFGAALGFVLILCGLFLSPPGVPGRSLRDRSLSRRRDDEHGDGGAHDADGRREEERKRDRPLEERTRQG